MVSSSSIKWSEIIGLQLTCTSMCVAAMWAISHNTTTHIQRELDHITDHLHQTNNAAQSVSFRAEELYERLVAPEVLDDVPPAPVESDWGNK